MTRPKEKDSIARAFRIRSDLIVRLDVYSKKSMISRTKLLERALE